MLHMFHTHVLSICFICFICMLYSSVLYSEVESHGTRPERHGMGCDEPGPTDGACWGPTVEVCSAPGVVRMGGTRPVVLISAPGSYLCGERRGFRGKERTRATAGTGFPRACVTEEAGTSGCALLSRRLDTSIS
jgi:hypothetical protein